MPNYNEQSATATTLPYTRVRYIGIRNPPDGIPQVEILEAEAVVLNGKKIHIGEQGGIAVGIDAAALAEVFPLKNPTSDELLGATATGQELMVMLYGWARHQQEKRDAAQASNLGLGEA